MKKIFVKQIRNFAIILFGSVSLLAATFTNAQTTGSDPSSVIAKYDILGVKLGMTESQARGALKSYVPSGGTTDMKRKAMKIEIKDNIVTNPNNRAPTRIGFTMGYYGVGVEPGYNSVKVYIQNDKVWGVWRRDMQGIYDLKSAKAAMLEKYPGAVNNPSCDLNHSCGVNLELREGNACSFAFSDRNSSESISVGRSGKYFRIYYSARSENGQSTITQGNGQLVDCSVGTEFFASMAAAAKDSAAQAQKKLGAAQL